MYPGSRYLRQLAARASGGSELKSELKGGSGLGGAVSSGVGGATAAGAAGLTSIAPLPNAGEAGAVQILSAAGQAHAYGIPASEDVGGGVYLDPAVLEDTSGGAGAAFHAGEASIYRLSAGRSSQEALDIPKVSL